MNSRRRVQSHGEVFTPKRIVGKMLDMPGIRQACENLTTTFLEPAAGEGVFLAEILLRKLQVVDKNYGDSLGHYENNSLVALATLYGIELLQDNVQKCIMNLYQIYYSAYQNQATKHGKKMKATVLSSARSIISKNIVQGDFLTKLCADGAPILMVQGAKVKFDVIIGNPPYQEMDGGAQASASPLYHHFVSLAKELNPDLISFIIPTRWYVSGKGLEDFRVEILNDPHLRELHDWLTPNDIFPNINIRGGVCYFLWDQSYDNSENLTRVVTYENNAMVSDIIRPLRYGEADIFIRDSQAISILDKVAATDDCSLMEFVSARNPFRFPTNFTRDSRFKGSRSSLEKPIQCYGNRGAVGYVELQDIDKNPAWIDKWKVLTPYSNNIGTELKDDNLNTIIARPGSICTETYLLIGAELDLDEYGAKALAKYMTTKFVRFLHSLAKNSQHGTRDTYRFVPTQDFSRNSTIDWSVSVQAVEKQLHAKYGLLAEEIQHIDQRIRDME